MEQKIFLSAFCKGKDWRKDVADVVEKIRTGLGSKSCDLTVFFVSGAYKNFDRETCTRYLSDELKSQVLVGCNASGIITNEKEIEMEPGISALSMHLPEVKLYPFYISPEDINSLSGGNNLINLLDIYPTDRPRFLCLADSASCDVSRLLHGFNEGYKGLPVIGGLASGRMMNVENWLSLGGAVYTEGAVGVAMVGNIEFEVIVSQGCRPIGEPFVITKAEDNVLFELAGRPALQVTQTVLEALTPKDRTLSEQALFVGIVMDEKRANFKRGDFLVRNIVGFDPATGALMIGEALKVGQTIQFQLRDADTSEEDLTKLLQKLQDSRSSLPQGGILVSCCGRGRGLYGKADHDVKMIQAMKGPLPLTGFFASGEIGPVGTKNYIHGYTSSLVIMR